MIDVKHNIYAGATILLFSAANTTGRSEALRQRFPERKNAAALANGGFLRQRETLLSEDPRRRFTRGDEPDYRFVDRAPEGRARLRIMMDAGARGSACALYVRTWHTPFFLSVTYVRERSFRETKEYCMGY